MPDDILDAAQKAINDAAGLPQQSAASPAIPPVLPVSPPASTTSPLPEEPAPIPPIEANPVVPPTVPATSNTGDIPKIDANPTPPPPGKDDKNAETPANTASLVESILETSTPTTVVPPPPGKHQTPVRKKSMTGAVLAVIALLLLALPVGVYYISQQNQQLADLRGRATGPPQPYGGTLQDCQNGGSDWEVVSEGGCANSGGGYRLECRQISTNTHYFIGCTGDDTTTTGDDTTVIPTNTPPNIPTNTPPTVIHECKNLKIFKGGTQVTPSSLLPGDAVVLSVTGDGAPTQARFRINGGAWQESTTAGTGAGEYTLAYTIPATGVTEFVIEAEVFVDGAWK